MLRVMVERQSDGPLHELSPNGGCALAPGQSQVAIIVKTDPDNTKQVRGISREPAIMRRASLSRGGRTKSHGTHRISRAVVNDILHEAGHQIRNARIEHGTSLRGHRLLHVAIGS